jgi:hypothetical protein
VSYENETIQTDFAFEKEREQEAALGRRQASKKQEHYAAWNGGELLPLEISATLPKGPALCNNWDKETYQLM